MELPKEKYIRLTHAAHKYAENAYGSRTNAFDISYTAYMTAATAEAERAGKLVEALEEAKETLGDILAADPKNFAANHAIKEIDKALAEYLNPKINKT